MALIGYVSYNWSTAYLKDLNLDKIREANTTIMNRANYIRGKYEDMSDMFLANPTIQKLLLDNLNPQSQSSMLSNKRTIEESLTDASEATYSIIAGTNGIVYQSSIGYYFHMDYDQIIDSEIYKQSQLSKGQNIWLPSNINIYTGKADPFLYLCRTYLSTAVLFKPLGQLIIQIPVDEIQQLFDEGSLDSREYYAIVDSNYKYIYHTKDKNLIGESVDSEIISDLSSGVDGDLVIHSGKEDYLLSYLVYKDRGWNVIHVMPMDIIRARAREVSNYIILIMLISMLIFMPVLVIILKHITNPIKALKTTVERFGYGDTQIRAVTDRLDEIGLLQNSFNKMAERINEQMLKIEEDHKQKRRMEINMLEYQINPHFLYNSLDFINWMACKAGNEDISEMVVALARFFRVGLSNGKEFYKIRDELDHAKQYLLINQLRLKDCFRFELQAEPDILDYFTIKILLQPVIENAIKHGIDKNKKDGMIRISAVRMEGDIIFEVSDNGKGIDKDKLHAIQALLANPTQIYADSGNGFGLYNVNVRLWMQYGDPYGVTLESSKEAGTAVRIKIPAITLSSS
jgi:two-component system sensor histidine kinase YesM